MIDRAPNALARQHYRVQRRRLYDDDDDDDLTALRERSRSQSDVAWILSRDGPSVPIPAAAHAVGALGVRARCVMVIIQLVVREVGEGVGGICRYAWILGGWGCRVEVR